MKHSNMARPSGFKAAYCDQARKLCRLGATDIEIADFFAVDVRTLYRWKNDHEEFCQALKEAKVEADARVEASLYHKALGYSFDAVKIFNDKDNGVTTVPYREQVPPDTTACIFWLKNRQPDRWRDKGPGDSADNPLHVADVTDQKRLAAVALMAARAVKAESADRN